MTLFAQVTLLAASGNTEDNQVNGFAADGAVTGASDFDDWRTALKTFYDTVYGLGGLRGIAQNNHIVKFYDITLPPPNYPIAERTFNLASAPAAIDMPLEVALCVSYKNTVNNAVPRPRRRGRIYISGWTEGANLVGRPGTTQYQGLANAYADYVADLNVIGTLEAGVWSRVDQIVYPIDEVWCDNEWDVQRRRGGKPTTRQTVSV